jgi:hypothetical protein
MKLEKEVLNSEECQWFLENIQKLQDELAKELRISLTVLDDQGDPVSKASAESTLTRLLKKSSAGKELYNRAYNQASDLITAHSDPVLLKVFDGLYSFWAPVATTDGTIIGSIVGGGGPFIHGEARPESFEEELADFYQNSGLKQAEVAEEDIKAAAKGTPVFEPEVVKRKLAELGRTIGILAEKTELGLAFGQTKRKDS